MSSTKKLLSVFLSVLMILSSVTVGLTALAADDIKIYDGLDENYQALATALQKSYVVDANNYVKVATRDYMATDNEDGDIRAASEAFYNIIDNSEKKRYGDAVKAVDTNLKAAMGSDYTTAMNKAIGNICGNGTISAYTSSLAYKFTVNQNINLILGEYSNASDVPDMAEKRLLFIPILKQVRQVITAQNPKKLPVMYQQQYSRILPKCFLLMFYHQAMMLCLTVRLRT